MIICLMILILLYSLFAFLLPITVAILKKTIPYNNIYIHCSQKVSRPTPLSIIALIAFMKNFAATVFVSHCIITGIVSIGNIKPDKIDAESRRIHWHIGDLESGEERIFNYIVYSKVGIVGKFSLPKALAVFEKEGNIHEVDSNSVFFMNEQARD